MAEITLPKLISSKIQSYQEIYLVKSDLMYDLDAIFDIEHIGDMCKFLHEHFKIANYIIPNDSEVKDDEKITLDQVLPCIMKFIDDKTANKIRLSAYYPEKLVYYSAHMHVVYGEEYDKYDDYDYQSLYISYTANKYYNRIKRRRFMTITIKKKYLNIP